MSVFDPTSPNVQQTVAAMVASIFANENFLNNTLTAHMADTTQAHGIAALLATQVSYNGHLLDLTAHGLTTVNANLAAAMAEIQTARGSQSNVNARLSTALGLDGTIKLSTLNNKWLNIPGMVPTFVDSTHFTLPGDWTKTCISGVQYRLTQSTVYSYAPQTGASVYSAGATTVTLDPGYPVLTSGLSLVEVALIAFDNSLASAITAQGVLITAIQAALAALQVPFKPSYVINGGMQIAQRPTAPALSTSAQFGQVDRWTAWASGGAVSAGTITQDTNSPIGRRLFALKLAGVTLTGSGVLSVRHRITGADAVSLMNASASFSAVVYQDTGGSVNYTVIVRTATAVDNFTGVNVISTSGVQVVPTATATKVVNLGVALPASAANGIEIEIQAACGAITTKNFSITEAKLEEGVAATAFVYADVEYDSAECYRYHRELGHSALFEQAGDGINISTTVANISIPFPYDMRAAPAVTVSAASDWQVLNAAGTGVAATAVATVANSVSKKGVQIAVTVAAGLVQGNSTIMQANNTANARLIFDAELG